MIAQEPDEERIPRIEPRDRQSVIERDARGVETWFHFEVNKGTESEHDRVVLNRGEVAVHRLGARAPARQIAAGSPRCVRHRCAAVAEGQRQRFALQRVEPTEITRSRREVRGLGTLKVLRKNIQLTCRDVRRDEEVEVDRLTEFEQSGSRAPLWLLLMRRCRKRRLARRLLSLRHALHTREQVQAKGRRNDRDSAQPTGRDTWCEHRFCIASG